MYPQNQIYSAEKRFRHILENYFTSVYTNKDLPSHGLEHHRRVWKHAKELLQVFPEIQQPVNFYEALIIASYLHDAGMAYETGPEHGWKSAELCMAFLEKNSLDHLSFPGLLEAIADHDDKNYITRNDNFLLKLLSLADDMDAYGFTGIQRYLEIYSYRGISLADSFNMIRTNATGRFRFFKVNVPGSSGLFNKQQARYLLLDDFMRNCENDVAGYHEAAAIISTPAIYETLKPAPDEHNPVMDWFRKGLSEELMQ